MTTTKPINLILSGLELFLNTNQSFEIMLFSRIFSCTYHKTFPPSHKQVALASWGMTIPCILHSIFHTFYNLLTKRIPLIIKSFFKMVICWPNAHLGGDIESGNKILLTCRCQRSKFSLLFVLWNKKLNECKKSASARWIKHSK